MNLFRLIDANNYYRRELEQDPTGLAPRTMIAGTRTGPLQVWVWDGKYANQRRRNIYPEYKAGRKRPAENIYAGIDLLKKALIHTSAVQVEINGWEADDIIAKLTRTTADMVEIWSTDMDFLQLSGEFPDRVFCGCNPRIPAKDVVLYKICVGDRSDNIKGIPKFGQKTWQGLTEEHKAILWRVINGTAKTGELATLPLYKNSLTFLGQHLDEVRKTREVVEFMDVPDHLIRENWRVGIPDYPRALSVLAEYMQ